MMIGGLAIVLCRVHIMPFVTYSFAVVDAFMSHFMLGSPVEATIFALRDQK